jgi:hypothetical protein
VAQCTEVTRYGRLGSTAPAWVGPAHRPAGFLAVHSRTSPSWFLLVAGGVLFALFLAAVLTSAVWYSTQYGVPTGREY